MNHSESIKLAIIDCGKSFASLGLFDTVIPEAAHLVASDPYAFVLASCLQRGTKAEIIWTIPYDIQKLLGHLDARLIYKMPFVELTDLFTRLPRRPRYRNDSPRTIKELTQIVVEECGGNAANIWIGKRATEVKRTLESIHGVGPGIANMTVLLIESAFSIHFDDLDHRQIDIKPDVHTIRVLFRLGASEAMTDQAAVNAARRINPDFPGALDFPLWNIGRTWCHPITPRCSACIIRSICAKRFSDKP